MERYPYGMTTAAPPFQPRPGRPDDALPILEAQRSAIRQTAASAYSPAIIDEWAPAVTVRERVETFQRWIEHGEELIVVAMEPAGEISLERGEHVMSSGGRMACVRMRKALRS
jgi:hypothetical protein